MIKIFTPTHTVDDDNQKFLEILSDYLNFDGKAITKEDVLAVTEGGVSKELAFSFLLALKFGIDPYGAERDFFNRYFVPSIKQLDIENYYNDAYNKYVKFEPKTVGNWQLTTRIYAPFEGFEFCEYGVNARRPSGVAPKVSPYFRCQVSLCIHGTRKSRSFSKYGLFFSITRSLAV